MKKLKLLNPTWLLALALLPLIFIEVHDIKPVLVEDQMLVDSLQAHPEIPDSLKQQIIASHWPASKLHFIKINKQEVDTTSFIVNHSQIKK